MPSFSQLKERILPFSEPVFLVQFIVVTAASFLVIVMNPSFVHYYKTQQKIHWTLLEQLQTFDRCHEISFCLRVSKHGTHLTQSFFMCKSLYKMKCTRSIEIYGLCQLMHFHSPSAKMILWTLSMNCRFWRPRTWRVFNAYPASLEFIDLKPLSHRKSMSHLMQVQSSHEFL